jgi:hypothetical protein
LAGKLVLIKAVLSSISIYQSALLLAPRSVIQKVEVMIRHFLWEGGKQTGRRLHLVKWGKLTKPFLEGGLQIKDMQMQNLALGAKILWNLITGTVSWSKRALWKKYFRGPRKKCLSNPTRPGKGSPIFSLCQKALPAFLPHLTWIPGNGQSINIWEDSVLGGAAISTRQELRRLKEWMQTNNIHSLWDISTWQNDENKSWSRWEIASLPHELEEEWSSLKEALQGRTPLREKKKDKIGWGSNAGIYTSARGYRHLVPGLQAPQDSAAWKVIWAVKTLPKVDLFVWTVAQKGVLSGENLRKKGWAGPTRCPLCCQAEETTIHLTVKLPLCQRGLESNSWFRCLDPSHPTGFPASVLKLASPVPSQDSKPRSSHSDMESFAEVYPLEAMVGKEPPDLQRREKNSSTGSS